MNTAEPKSMRTAGGAWRPRYVLLTSAKNEAAYIERAITSVLRQSWLPAAWFIVDDGSTDQTAALIGQHAARHTLIHMIAVTSGPGRSFGSKCAAIKAAYERAALGDFDFIGVHDADIELQDPRYFESVLNVLIHDPSLGISGGFVHERKNRAWSHRPANSADSVAGGIQMFRRACFERIGGYTSMPFGGEDWLAEIDARLAGWSVRAIPELEVRHHRPTSSADGRLKGLFRLGMMDASFGSDPFFELFKCIRRLSEKPRLLGTLIRLSGFVWFNLSIRSPVLPRDQVEFLRAQQVNKLRNLFSSHAADMTPGAPP
jgi:hypothetical protein